MHWNGKRYVANIGLQLEWVLSGCMLLTTYSQFAALTMASGEANEAPIIRSSLTTTIVQRRIYAKQCVWPL
jgi:hypothetical protein